MKSDPATEIDEIVTGAFPDDDSVTVLVAVCPTFTPPNETVVLLSARDGVLAFNWIAKLFVVPFALAVTLAVCPLPTAATVAEKLAADAPLCTVTDGGTVTAALLLLSATAEPPLGAPALRVTVHAVVPAPVIV